MFLKLDEKAADRTAAADMQGRILKYGEIVRYAERFRKAAPERAAALILCRNDVPVLQVYLACMVNRIVPLLVGEKTEAGALQNLIRAYRPAYAFGYRDALEKALPGRMLREAVEGTGFCAAETGLEAWPLYPDLSLLLTTSGSTGSPKLVRHSYSNLEEQAKNIASFFEMDGTERPMADLPVMYTYGLSVVSSHLYAGAEVLLADESILSKNFWAYFRERGATSFTGVPYSFELLKRLNFFRMDLPSLNLLSQGGGKLAEELQMEFARCMAERGGRYIATYGQTECTARMAYLPPELALEKCGSIGKAIPNGKLYLKDEDGNLIQEPGKEGELYYEGPNVTLGYAERGEDLAKGDERHGVIATGDLARMDGDGYFYISGRKKRFLKLYGYRVGLDECEGIVKSVFSGDCACTGTDRKLTVCITEAGKEEAVKALLLEKTGLYSMAVDVRTVDRIPRNEAGKVLYAELEGMLGEDPAE